MANAKHEDAVMKMGFDYFRNTILKTLGIDYQYEEISPEANTITLQLYEVKNDTAHQVSEEKMDKDPSDDIYEESTVYVYDGGESPIDSAIPIGDNFTIQIR